jgi:hypothetical protein
MGNHHTLHLSGQEFLRGVYLNCEKQLGLARTVLSKSMLSVVYDAVGFKVFGNTTANYMLPDLTCDKSMNGMVGNHHTLYLMPPVQSGVPPGSILVSLVFLLF